MFFASVAIEVKSMRAKEGQGDELPTGEAKMVTKNDIATRLKTESESLYEMSKFTQRQSDSGEIILGLLSARLEAAANLLTDYSELHLTALSPNFARRAKMLGTVATNTIWEHIKSDNVATLIAGISAVLLNLKSIFTNLNKELEQKHPDINLQLYLGKFAQLIGTCKMFFDTYNNASFESTQLKIGRAVSVKA